MSLRRIQTTDETINRVQSAVEDALRPLEAGPLSDGTSTVIAAIAATDTKVHHGLRRTPRGWIVTRLEGLATLAEVTASTDPARFVYLRASVPVTAHLLFY